MRKIKSNNNKKQIVENPDMNVKTLIKTFIFILVAFLIFYGLTMLIVNNKKEKEIEKIGLSENSDTILINELLSQKEDLYYVLVARDSQDIYNFYEKNLSKKTFYKIDLNNAFNKNIIGSETVIDEDLKNIKISDSTLFVIEGNKLKEYYVGLEDITAYLRTIAF